MKQLQNDIVKFWMEDGILYNEFLIPIDLTQSNTKSIIELRNEISKPDKQYWCFDFKNVKSMPKDGRDYTDKHGQDFLHASAALVNSPIQAFIVNIFIKLKNPKVPFKAFVKKEDALNWLEEIKTKKESNKK